MPLKWDNKIILAKIEVTEGTDAVPTGALNAMLMTNVSFTPMEGQEVTLDYELPYLGADASIPAALTGRLKGKVWLAGSSVLGTPPAWAPLLRACGVAQVVNAGVSCVYNPISDVMDSLTWHFWTEGTRYTYIGSRGDATLVFPAQGLPYIEVDILGLFVDPSETARAVPVLTGFKPPVLVSKANTPTFTVNAVPLVLRQFTLSLNNKVEPRLLVPTEQIVIPERADMMKAQVEAVPLGTFNPFALAKNQTKMPVTITHGTAVGNRFTLSCPSVQLKRTASFALVQKLIEWPLEGAVLPTTGNDQWTLTCT
jgi:hypothetical protein